MNRGQNHSGRADAALRAVTSEKRRLQRMQALVQRETFDRSDAASIRLGSRDQTTVHQLPIHKHGTRAALAFAAPFFCAGQNQVVTKHIQQSLHRIHEQSRGRAIYSQPDFLLAGLGACGYQDCVTASEESDDKTE
jgi:hypothetical protein